MHPGNLAKLKAVARRILGAAAPLFRASFRYLPNRFSMQLWRSLGKPLARGSWRFTVSTRYGFRMSGETRDLVGRYIYYFGLWEPDITEWIFRNLKSGETFIDVGANIGYYSLLASRIVGDAGAVVAIEASPSIFRSLEANLKLNRATNVRAVNLAISDSVAKIPLYAGPMSNRGQTSTLHQEGFEHEADVDAVPLAAVLTDDELHNARIFKIDVEGAEWSVISAFRDRLQATQVNAEFVIEITPEYLSEHRETADSIFQIFADAGFRPYAIRNDYSWESYRTHEPYRPPQRLYEIPLHQTDVVFSRRDAKTL